MAASHKGAISFGLVHIPIALYTATQDNDIHFNQLCKEDLSRVRYKKTCAGCGKEITKYTHPAVNEAELAMAKTLINSMNQEFQPELYKDEYQERLKALIEQKIAGKEIVSAKQEEQGNVIDLMEALKASIEQAGSNKPKRGGRSKKVKGAS